MLRLESGARAAPPGRGAERLALVAVGVCGVAIESAWLGVLALGDLKPEIVTFEWLFFGAFAAYLIACWILLREPGPQRAALALILTGAILFRATLLLAPPTLSDDLHRYVWEGKVLSAGWSPYRYPPDAPELEALRDALWPAINNKGVPSPYPPLAQGFGLLAHVLFPAQVTGPKVLATLGDLAALGALLPLLRRLGLPLTRAVIYAWSPLVVVAFAHSGHNDAWMIALLVTACAFAVSARPTASAASLALATLAKTLPLLALPLFATAWGRRWRPWAVYAGVLAAGYLPLLILGGGAPGSVVGYTLTWTGNDSLFFLLRMVFDALDLPLGRHLAEMLPADLVRAGLPAREVPGLLLAKVVSLAAIGLGIAALCLHPALQARPLPWRVLALFGLILLWASTVNPWYVTALVPFLAITLQPGRWPAGFAPPAMWGWLLFTGTAALPYLTYGSGRWLGWGWVPLVEYLPLYALLLAGAVAGLTARRRTASSAPVASPPLSEGRRAADT